LFFFYPHRPSSWERRGKKEKDFGWKGSFPSPPRLCGWKGRKEKRKRRKEKGIQAKGGRRRGSDTKPDQLLRYLSALRGCGATCSGEGKRERKEGERVSRREERGGEKEEEGKNVKEIESSSLQFPSPVRKEKKEKKRTVRRKERGGGGKGKRKSSPRVASSFSRKLVKRARKGGKKKRKREPEKRKGEGRRKKRKLPRNPPTAIAMCSARAPNTPGRTKKKKKGRGRKGSHFKAKGGGEREEDGANRPYCRTISEKEGKKKKKKKISIKGKKRELTDPLFLYLTDGVGEERGPKNGGRKGWLLNSPLSLHLSRLEWKGGGEEGKNLPGEKERG